MNAAIVAALALVVVGAVYISARWRRSPQAHRAMVVLAAGYFVAGALAAAWTLHLATRRRAPARFDVHYPFHHPYAHGPLPVGQDGKVVSVTDGDTIDVSLEPKGLVRAVRLYGIDAPEHDQAFGPQSTQHLAALVSGRTVTLRCENRTSYGRLICKVLLADGEDTDLDQLKAGMAWDYRQYQDEQTAADRTVYSAAECKAMKAKIGLWSEPNPIQPQDFRHGTHSQLLLDADGCRRSSEPTSGQVRGNVRSHIFEWPGCPYYSSISPDNRVSFASPQAAEQAGYRPAHNCP